MKRLLFIIAVALSMVIMTGAVKGPRVGPGGQGLVVGMPSDVGRRGVTADVVWDTLTYLFTPDSGMDHFFATYDAAVAGLNATVHPNGGRDSLIQFDSEASFAWAMLDADETNSLPVDLDSGIFYRMTVTDSVGNDWQSNLDGGRHIIMHFPFEDYIPANSQIVSATMHVYNEGNSGWAENDSVSTTLMTTGDGLWYGDKGYTSGATIWPNYGKCTWDWQTSAIFGGSDVAWTTDPASKGWFWQWGDYSDLTGNNAATVADGTEKIITITNCVQGATSGAVNNGIVFQYQDFSAEVTNQWVNFDASTTSALDLKRPWIEVKFLTRAYRKPFGTADWAFVFSTDDGRVFNKNMADTFAVRDAAFSMFVPDLNGVSIGDPASMSPDLLMHCYDVGMEVGSHGVYQAPLGLASWDVMEVVANGDYWQGMYPTAQAGTANGPDSLQFDIDPQFLYYLAANEGYADSLKSDLRFGKAFGLPQNFWSPEIVSALIGQGYGAMRTQRHSTNAIIDANGNYLHVAIATRRPARADTMVIGFDRTYPRQPRNMIGSPPTFAIGDLMGDSADSALVDMDQKSQAFHHMAEIMRANGQRVVAAYAHAHRADASYERPPHDGGVDPDQMGIFLDTALGLNGRGGVPGRVFTVGGLNAFMRSQAAAVATPTGWNPAASDSFHYTIEDGVWFKPYGVDDSPVPGLK